MINSHNGIKEKNIPPINIDDYPAVKRHLDQYYDQLEKRQDKGVTPYNLRNCAYLEEFDRQKIIYSEIVQDCQFYLDKDCTYYPEATSFIITGENTQYLSIMLNSKLLTFAFKSYYSGGGLSSTGFRYKKAFIINLPVIKPHDDFAGILERLNNSFIDGFNENIDKCVDLLIYKLYELNYQDIKLIDPTIDNIFSEFKLTPEQYENMSIEEIAELSKRLR